MRLVSIAAVAAALIATPAFAQNDWTGFHVGVGVGVGHQSSDLSAGAEGDGSSDVYYWEDEFYSGDYQYWAEGYVDGAANAGKSRFLGTVEAGYDYQTGGDFVVGVFGNYDFGSKKGSRLHATGSWAVGEDYDYLDNESIGGDGEDVYNETYDHGDLSINARAALKDSWALGARAGYLASPSTLLYVAGGYTQAKVRLDGEVLLDGSPDFMSDSISDSKWKGGYFIGGGIETLLGNNVSAKLEYRYADYGKYSISGGDTFTIADFYGDTGVDVTGEYGGGVSATKLHNQSVRLVLSYRFQ